MNRVGNTVLWVERVIRVGNTVLWVKGVIRKGSLLKAGSEGPWYLTLFCGEVIRCLYL